MRMRRRMRAIAQKVSFFKFFFAEFFGNDFIFEIAGSNKSSSAASKSTESKKGDGKEKRDKKTVQTEKVKKRKKRENEVLPYV